MPLSIPLRMMPTLRTVIIFDTYCDGMSSNIVSLLSASVDLVNDSPSRGKVELGAA